MNRREFLIQTATITAAGFCGWGNLLLASEGHYHAQFYTSLPENGVQCELCPHRCMLKPSQSGICKVRRNEKGKLYSLNYGQVCAYNSDPIEKKPFYHFYPGHQALSLAAAGCNLSCTYCQNWEISQYPAAEVDSRSLTSRDIVDEARKNQVQIVAFTYSEPTVFYEYMIEIARVCTQFQLKTAMISAGFIQPRPLEELCRHLSAIKIDLKSMSETFYRQVCGARLKDVLASLTIIKKSSTWLEIVYLVVPTLNDSLKELTDTARWIKNNLGSDVPLHFSRFYPNYKLQNFPPTPIKTLEQACEAAVAEGLQFVYAGNIPGHKRENTYCPACKSCLIKRYSYTVLENRLQTSLCPDCGRLIPGRW